MPLKWKLILIGVVAVASAIAGWPPGDISLGLDLRGGIHLLIGVDTDDAVKAALDEGVITIRQRLRELKVDHDEPEVDFDAAEGRFRLLIRGIEGENLERVRKAAKDKLEGFDVVELPDGIAASLIAARVEFIRDRTVEQALNTIGERINAYGVSEPLIQRQGGPRGERILLQLPGVDDDQRVKALIGKVAFLELKLVDSGPYDTVEGARSNYQGNLPQHLELVEQIGPTGDSLWLAVEKVASVTGKDLTRADPGRDQYNRASVHFGLNSEGAKKFSRVTGANIGKRLAIVLDGQVKSAPNIEGRISDSGEITGEFTTEEARDLSLVLRAGALPAKIRYLEDRTVGPSLGYDSIVRGVTAALLGLALVVVFMLIYYRLSGVNAVVALALNMVIMLGALKMLDATLTLPGIAGYILTIGMAVDANVIIFERIREELRIGKNVRQAIDGGFSKAFMTIFDANITTLIAAVLLIQFGTGPIRGFAVTLSIGIVASMFTAIFVSKTIYQAFVLRPGQVPSELSI